MARGKESDGSTARARHALPRLAAIVHGVSRLPALLHPLLPLLRLQLLLALRRNAPIAFELGVCTVDPLTDGFNPAPLQSYVRDTLGLPYHFEQQPIIEAAVRRAVSILESVHID